MIITHKIKMDLTRRELVPPIDMAQDDKYSRNLELALFCGNKAVIPPQDCAVLVRYQKSDGHGGCYDTLPDGTTAWHTSGNTLTVALAPQVLTVSGRTELIVTILAGRSELSTFRIPLEIQPRPDFMAKSEQYISTTCFIPQPTAAEIGQYLAVAGRTDGGRIITVEGVDPPKSAYQLAQEGGYTGTEAEFSENLAAQIPTKTSQLVNDSGYITCDTLELDHYYTVGQVDELMEDLPSKEYVDGQLARYQIAGDYALRSELPNVPVQSVNGKTGIINLSSEDVGADTIGTADAKVTAHNTATDSHEDIRLLVSDLSTRLTTLADSDDTTLDQMSELVAYVKSNKSLIDAITTGKVSFSDIVDNLSTNVAGKPLSAAQGVALKALIDAIIVPTKTSQLTNDSGYLTSVPVTSVNSKMGAVILTAADTGAVPVTQTLTLTGVDEDGVSHSWTIYGVVL